MSTSTNTRVEKPSTVVIPVADVDGQIDFYVEKLGFEKRSDTPYGDGQRWVEVAPAGAATRIALVPPTDDAPPGGPARVAFATKDADADHADLKARGVDVDEEVMRMGGPVPPMFWFRDPDGNSLLIVEDETA